MKDSLKAALIAFFKSLREAAKARPLILMALSFIEEYLTREIDKLFAVS